MTDAKSAMGRWVAKRDGLWVHPGALCGLLLGVSRTTVGWEWSGQPARVARL